MTRYGLASIFEHTDDGFEFVASNTPLHLTHVDVLEIDMKPGVFIPALSGHLSKEPEFIINLTEDTFLGPDKDIPVTLVELTQELKAFHNRLLKFLLSNGATFENPQFLDEQYTPHISIYGSRRVELGTLIPINSVSIGSKRTDTVDPPFRIIATLDLV